MRAKPGVISAIVACCVGLSCASALAQDDSRVAGAPTEISTAGKFTFVLFWREDDAVTREMSAKLQAAVAARPRAEWMAVNVGDSANQSIVDRYGVSRAPMPLVLCVGPNGAVTGALSKQITAEAIDRALVTPTMIQCIKALQEGKLVLVHVRPDDASALPSGASQFASDPEFHARIATISFRRDDPSEERFLTDMKIDANATGSVVALLAPPAVLVGRFSDSATKAEIASELHAAGQCCDDPNCKHNKQRN